MAYAAAVISVGSTAVPLLAVPRTGGRARAVLVVCATAELRIGGPDVSVAQGYPVPAGSDVPADLLNATDVLWAVTATGVTASVNVLQCGF